MTVKWLPSYAPVDEEFGNVSLLLHGDGTNGSTTIVDSSSSPKAVTAVGDAQISTAQSKFGGSSIAFDGTGDYLSISSNTALALGSTWTIEFFVYLNTFGGGNDRNAFVSTGTLNTNGHLQIYTEVGPKLVVRCGGTGGNDAASGSSPFNPATWTHLAFVSNNLAATIYVNGLANGTGTLASASTEPIARIGNLGISAYDLDGYIDDLRITKGVARYTSNFTPPTAPFPDLSPSGRITIEDNSLDVDARQYIINVEEQDGQSLESGVRTAINDFVVGCKADGIWDAIKASCILAGARTLDGALVPLVGGAPTNNNFVSGDYDRKTGLVGDGSTKYLDSNRLDSDDPLDNFHCSTYLTTAEPTSNVVMYMGLLGRLQHGSNATNAFFASKTTGFSNATGSGKPVNFFGQQRSSLTTETARVNGNTYAANTTAAANLASPIFVFRFSQNPTPYYPSARLAFYSIGESLDLAALDTRVSNLITAIGAAIP